MNNIPYDIKKMRKNYGLTQQEFAAAIGITREMIGQMERGEKNMSKATKILIKNFIDNKNKQSSATEEPKTTYLTQPMVDNPADFITHKSIETTALLRVILRSQAEVLAEKRSESVTKVLGELSKAVSDEISVSISELQQGS